MVREISLNQTGRRPVNTVMEETPIKEKRKPGRKPAPHRIVYEFDLMGYLTNEYPSQWAAMEAIGINAARLCQLLSGNFTLRGKYYSHDKGFQPKMKVEVFTFHTGLWVPYRTVRDAARATGCSEVVVYDYLSKVKKGTAVSKDGEPILVKNRYMFRRPATGEVKP